MTEGKSIFTILWEQIKSNLFSMILETLIMFIIASYAIYEIKQTREDVRQKIEISYNNLSNFSKLQAEKIEKLTDQVDKLNYMLSSVLGVAVEDIEKNKEEYYNNFKENSKIAIKNWLEKRKMIKEKQRSDKN